VESSLSSKQWQVTIIAALASIIIGLVVVEIGLRIMGIEYPLFYDYDPYLGNRLRPGAKGYWIDEGDGYVSINSDGLRDYEHPVSHPANTLRIAVLGDSYAEAMQVNEDQAFWAVMGKKLQGCESLRGRKVEVINFGVSGYGTTQELLTLRHKVWKYSPDVVLLAFTTGNDISDNSRALKQIVYHPYQVYQGNKLVLDDHLTRENWEAKQHGPWKEMHLDVLLNLRVFQVILHAKDMFWQWWLFKDPGRVVDPAIEGHEWGIYDQVYQGPTTKVWKEAWRVTEGVLLQMRDEVVQKGARFYVVTLSTGIQVNPDPAKRKAFAKALGVRDLFNPDHRLEGFCQGHHIPILLLGPLFQEYATQHKVYLHGFGRTLGRGHWNQNGHRLAGVTIAKWLCPQLQ
jgi:hypothetical protein